LILYISCEQIVNKLWVSLRADSASIKASLELLYLVNRYMNLAAMAGILLNIYSL